MPAPILMLLSSSPFDPSAGSPRSVLEVAYALAAQGREVHCLATTAVEAAQPLVALPWLAQLGIHPEVDRRGAVGRGCTVLRARSRGVAFTLLDTGKLGVREFDFVHGVQFSRLLAQVIDEVGPSVVVTTGGTPPEQSRRELVRQSGAALVLHVSSEAALHPLGFEHVDGVIAGSGYLAGRYKALLGSEPAQLNPLIDDEDVLAPTRTRRFVTFVNPTPGKGVYFAVRLFDQLQRAIPGIRIRVVATRGTGDQMLVAARRGGINLSISDSLTICGPVARPRDLWAQTGILLMPSVQPEPVARLALEAAANGVAVISSGRGALGCWPAGISTIVPVPAEMTAEHDAVASQEAVVPWVEEVARLSSSGPLLAAEEMARSAMAVYRALSPAERAPVAIDDALRLGDAAAAIPNA